MNKGLFNWTWPKEAFRDFYAYSLTAALVYSIYAKPELRDVSIAVLMLVVKFYFDSTASSVKKDNTIASMADSIPNIDKENTKP